MKKYHRASLNGQNPQRGTILMEVLIAVAILSVSIVVILESLTASARAASRAKHYLEASNLLDNKMAEFLMLPGESLKNSHDSLKGNLNDYLFHLSEGHQSFQGDVDLQTITMTQEWGQGRNKGSISLPLVYYDKQP